eukprot:525876_1
MATSSEECKHENTLCIGTWNVHNWQDINKIIKILDNKPCDIVGLQEATRVYRESLYLQVKDAFAKFKKELNFQYLSTEKHETNFYSGVAMASQYDIIKSIQISNKMEINIIKYIKNIKLGIIVAHFDYRDEKIRIAEYKKLLPIINKYYNLPLIFIGDFNALTKTDYTIEEWNKITEIRTKNEWELPQTQLLTAMKQNNYFYDCLYLFQRKKDNEQKDNNDNDMKYEAKWDGIFVDRNDLGTCRYNTRIDYVLINKQMEQLFEITNYQHIEHNNASDHKLVRVEFKLK